MDLQERHGLAVSIIFILLSMVVAEMKTSDTTNVTLRGTGDIIIPVNPGRKVSLPQQMHVPICPGDKCQKWSSGQELDEEALTPKNSPTAQHEPSSDKSVSVQTEGTIMKVLNLSVNPDQKVILPQEMHVQISPDDKYKKQSSRRELNEEALTPKNSPTAQHEPSSDKSVSVQIKDTTMKVLKLCGGVLPLSILLLPFFCLWTSGSLQNALILYPAVNIACTAFASYAWLAYSVLQVSYKDQNEVIGIDAIIINGCSWGFIAFLLLGILMCKWEARGTVCLVGLFFHVILSVTILQFPIFKWVEKESRYKIIIGLIAAAFQNTAEVIPMINLIRMWLANAPEEGYPQIPNYKKFTMISRALDSISTLYWLLYCLFTYEFDIFGISNIVCGVLSVISLCVHAAWAMRPN